MAYTHTRIYVYIHIDFSLAAVSVGHDTQVIRHIGTVKASP